MRISLNFGYLGELFLGLGRRSIDVCRLTPGKDNILARQSYYHAVR